MDPKELLKRRFLELAEQATSKSYLTHTPFLSLEEQGYLQDLAYEKKADLPSHKIGGAHYFRYGGYEDAERQVLFFYPEIYEEASLLAEEEDGADIVVLHIAPKKAEFASPLTHRDYLGALMALGYKREMIGDIVVVGKEAYAFTFKSIAEELSKNLIEVGPNVVRTSILAPKAVAVKPSFEEVLINVASTRIDAIIGEVFHLSRDAAKSEIEKGNLLLNGVAKDSASYLCLGGELVVLKGYGKFVYLGEVGTSRKGRVLAKIKRYR